MSTKTKITVSKKLREFVFNKIQHVRKTLHRNPKDYYVVKIKNKYVLTTWGTSNYSSGEIVGELMSIYEHIPGKYKK